MLLALICDRVAPSQHSQRLLPLWIPFPVVGALLLVCLMWGAVSPASALGSDWRVLPAELNLSADYPGRLVILERQGDDVWIDRTVSDVPRIHFAHPDWLKRQPGGVIAVDPDSCPDNSQTTITLELGGETHRVPVRIKSSRSASPIFPREVAAVLGKAGCNLGTCHGNLHGKAGFRLSLRGDDPLMDFTSVVRGHAARRIDMLAPEQSLLIRKPLGSVAHQGGVRFAPDSAEAQILRRWIAEGCRWNAQSGLPCPTLDEAARADETVVSLQVLPQRLLAAKASRTQQLAVLAGFADGSIRDVTAWARYEPSVVTGVEINSTGLVSAAQAVDVSISISYLNGRAASRLTFLPHDTAPSAQTATNSRVDQLIENQLVRYQLQAQPLAGDYVFVRRAYITIAGRLPTAMEVRQFADDTKPDKHQRLIEELMMDPAYAMTWAMRWSDLLRNEQKVMSQQGAENWHAWLAQQIANDRPINAMVAEMLTTTGSTYEHPAASFHRTHRDPETAAESIGQVFLGVRLQCARCHNHPFDAWRQDDYYGLAAYFTTLERKQLDNAPKDKFDKHIISGDEVISLAKRPAEIWHPGRAGNVPPKPLTNRVDDAQQKSSNNAQATPLEQLATWLTVDNRMFARNMANRIWYHYMGVGIVDPPDDFRDSNPPSHPELLEYLTDELVRSNYSTRHVSRLILVSQAFRRASIGEATLDQPLGGPRSFAGYPIRRMPAEVLYDAVSDVTGILNPTEGAGKSTVEHRAMARVEVPTKSGFMTTFGKPGRLLVCECERTSEVSLGQSLVLVNGTETREKLASTKNYLSRLLDEPSTMQSKLEELYLTALARPPRTEETQRLSAYIAAAPSSREALEDILWALLNSKEFPLIR